MRYIFDEEFYFFTENFMKYIFTCAEFKKKYFWEKWMPLHTFFGLLKLGLWFFCHIFCQIFKQIFTKTNFSLLLEFSFLLKIRCITIYIITSVMVKQFLKNMMSTQKNIRLKFDDILGFGSTFGQYIGIFHIFSDLSKKIYPIT